MASQLIVVGLVSAAMFAYTYFSECVARQSPMSGDRWYVRQFAFVGGPISPPYCWRPLFPLLGRYLGFDFVSYSTLLATPGLIYLYAGRDWTAVAIALAFVGNPHIFRFAVRNPEYDVSFVHFLLLVSVWAAAESSWLAFPLSVLLGMTRETTAAAFSAVALFLNPWLAIPPMVGVAVSYLARNESRDDKQRHPLVESTTWGTLGRWARIKGHNFFHFAHVVQPLRGIQFCVPFVWGDLGSVARAGLAGFAVTWLGAMPASGQSRHVTNAFVFFIPVIYALGAEWAWAYALLSWWWPIDYNLFNESGGQSFAYVRGTEVQQLQSPSDSQDSAG